MRKLADAIGLSATALYRHFPNQHAILGEIADAGFDMLADRMERPFDSDDPVERLLEMMDRYIIFAHEESRIFDLMLRIHHKTMRVYPQDYVAGKSRTANILIAEVQRCLVSGRWKRDDPAELLLTIWAMGHGHAVLYEAGRIAGNVEDIRAMARRALIRLFEGLAQPIGQALPPPVDRPAFFRHHGQLVAPVVSESGRCA